ncbi:(d)CMP kinase [Mycetocola manganoxydans]|uniref:Cytidylate kinase n=1 Tax=Mycetocola manganoxydans TaxID=699879 RepID=A0A3L6ZMI3_9MICO|nr:(d)CMP kinase [Mycetocola manganoxydans]RLP69073.1 (d)CMP kinase [Mycetocola manganoxydans]GHD51630.1 cytidylate kinase [Mycetocola manganoxydans]
MTKTVVAVDGPAGSGKSSVSKAAATRLGFDYLDTGAAYRALSWYILDAGIDSADAAAVVSSLGGFDYTIGTDPIGYHVRVGQTDVTDSIREPRVTAVVSNIARVPEVRAHVTGIFRDIIRDSMAPGIVVEGRDITTVVAPDATARILLTATEEARMSRRSAELASESASEVASALQKRDRADSRVVDFMTAAPGVTTVDSTTLNFDETVDAVLDVIRTSQKP